MSLDVYIRADGDDHIVRVCDLCGWVFQDLGDAGMRQLGWYISPTWHQDDMCPLCAAKRRGGTA